MAHAGAQTSITDNSNRTEHKPAVSFNDLPRELRDMIYYELWLHSPAIRLSRSYYGLIQHNPGSMRRTSGLPLWLLANKNTFREGVKSLSKTAMWYYHLTLRPRSPRRGPSVVSFAATSLTLYVRYLSPTPPRYNEGPAKPIELCMPAQRNEVLSKFGPQLKHLTFDLGDLNLDHSFCGACIKAYDDPAWSFSTEFPDTGRLQLDSLSLRCTVFCEYCVDLERLSPGLKAMFAAVTRRIAAASVGHNGEVEVQTLSEKQRSLVFFTLYRRTE